MLMTTPLPDFVDVFPDHRDPRRLYALPDRLELQMDDALSPRFALLRFANDDLDGGGGLIQAALQWRRTDLDQLAAAVGERTVELPAAASAEARLVLRGTAADTVLEAGQWQPLRASSADALSITHHLTRQDSQILAALTREPGEGGPQPVELELRCVVPGLRPGLPWTAEAEVPALFELLRAQLPGDRPCTAVELEMAFLGLPAGVLSFRPATPGEPAVPDETLRRIAARRALETFLRPVPGGHEWHPGALPAAGVPRAAWGLGSPTPDTLTRTLRWSIRDLYETHGQRDDVFPVVTPFQPLKKASVCVLCALPMHPEGLAQLDVELRFRGASGAPVHKTLVFDGSRGLATVGVVLPAFGSGLELGFRTTLYVARDGQPPRTLSSGPDFQPVAGLQVVVDRVHCGVRPLCLRCDAAVWRHTDAVDGRVATATGRVFDLRLTPGRPLRWLVLQGEDALASATVEVSVALAHGERHVLRAEPLLGDEVLVTGWALEPAAPDVLTLRLAESLAARSALVAVELIPGPALPADGASGTWLTLDPHQTSTWSHWRDSVLQPPGYAWRLHWVERDASGATRPLRDTPWQTGQANELTVDVAP